MMYMWMYSITSSDNTNVALKRTKFKSKHLTLHNCNLMTADLPSENHKLWEGTIQFSVFPSNIFLSVIFLALYITDNLKNGNFVKLTKVNVSPQDDSDLPCATSSNKLVNLVLISGRTPHLSTPDITICPSGQMSLTALSRARPSEPRSTSTTDDLEHSSAWCCLRCQPDRSLLSYRSGSYGCAFTMRPPK